MKIGRIGGFNPIEVLGRTSETTSLQSTYRFQESFDFSELPNNPNQEENTSEAVQALAQILFQIMFDALIDGCWIISRNPRGNHEFIIEASFVPPAGKGKYPIIYLPLFGITEEIMPINHLITTQRSRIADHLMQLIAQLTATVGEMDLIKLILLFSHEYGHFISFQRGYHDQDLKLALSLFYSKIKFSNKADYYAYVILREELSAWRFAEERLLKLDFTYFDHFIDIKYKSLSTYYKQLNLANARIETYSKLSLLAIDLSKLC